jgi:AbrB family looped-hinge helix DNA binding protein
MYRYRSSAEASSFDCPLSQPTADIHAHGKRSRRHPKAVIGAWRWIPYNIDICKDTKESIMSEATLTSKGQVTIPAEIRKALGLNAGERVVFTQLDDGTTVMRAKTRSILELQGMLKPARIVKRKVGIQDMNIGQS